MRPGDFEERQWLPRYMLLFWALVALGVFSSGYTDMRDEGNQKTGGF